MSVAVKSAHRLQRVGTGHSLWGRCPCGWGWLGTYAGNERRLTKLRAAFAEHLERAAKLEGMESSHGVATQPVEERT